jgi:hypothetical protein
MATSHYFPINYGGFKGEQNLIQDLVDEQIKLFGCDIYYLPRKLIKNNALDDLIYSEFNQKIVIEMLLQNVEGFGQSEFISKFGLKVTDEIRFAVSKRRWDTEISRLGCVENKARPLEGDLLYFPLTKDLYEIKFVEVEAAFHQLGKLYFYQITAEIYEMGNETIDTNIEEIDLIEDILSPAIDIVMVAGSGTTKYLIGEMVEGSTSGFIGKVVKWIHSKKTLRVISRTGTFVEGESIVGEDSGASWVIDTFNTQEDPNTEYEENKYIEDESNDVLDFSETNAFGEYGNFMDSF